VAVGVASMLLSCTFCHVQACQAGKHISKALHALKRAYALPLHSSSV
jgi:hypothetical protein